MSAENAGIDNVMHAKLATKVVQTRNVETERIVFIMVVGGRGTLDGTRILLETHRRMFAMTQRTKSSRHAPSCRPLEGICTDSSLLDGRHMECAYYFDFRFHLKAARIKPSAQTDSLSPSFGLGGWL